MLQAIARLAPWSATAREAAHVAVWLGALALSFALALQPPPARAPQDVDFDATGAGGLWRVTRGGEFRPGAVVRMNYAPGVAGQAIGASFGIGCDATGACARYAGLIWLPSAPLLVGPGDTLSVQARAAGRVRLAIRLIDSDGDTFQSKGLALDNEWRELRFALSGMDGWERWGSGDNAYTPPLRAVAFLVGAPAPVAGAFQLDDIRFQQTAQP